MGWRILLALGAAKIKATENRVPRVFDKVCSREPHVEIHRPSCLASMLLSL